MFTYFSICVPIILQRDFHDFRLLKNNGIVTKQKIIEEKVDLYTPIVYWKQKTMTNYKPWMKILLYIIWHTQHFG